MSAVGKMSIHHETEHAVHNVWGYIVWAAETIIFFLAGIIVGFRVLNDESGHIRNSDYYRLPILYIFMNFARAISISAFWPILSTTGYKMTRSEMTVVIWGGLRGAVGIAFALIAANDT